MPKPPPKILLEMAMTGLQQMLLLLNNEYLGHKKISSKVTTWMDLKSLCIT
jgi:hypothetical protein